MQDAGFQVSGFRPKISLNPRSRLHFQRSTPSAKTHRAFRATAMQTWREVVAAA
jgi:hypothetical protein